MANVQKVLFYLDDDGSPFPIEMPWADVLGSTGITASDGSVIVPQIINNALRMVNFAPPPANPSAKFGSILAICYVYDDGAKAWVQSVTRTGPNSVNVKIAEGNHLEGMTLAQARAKTGYAKPYIGYATANDYVEYVMEPPIAPPPPPPHNPLQASLNPGASTVKVNEPITLTATWSGDNTVIQSIKWSDGTNNYTEKTPIHTFVFQQPGTYTVTFQVTNAIGETATATSTITVRNPYPITVDIQENNMTIQKGNSMTFHATVTTEGAIKSQSWTIPSGIDVQSQTADQATLIFNQLGVYTIRYTATNADDQSASDTCTITVVEPPKKKLDVGLFIETNEGEVEVDPSLTLNNFPLNLDNIKLHFRNTGESNWTTEFLSIEIGGDSYKFSDGSTQHYDKQLLAPGKDYVLGSLTQNIDQTARYTFVIKVIVNDDQGQSMTKFFELKLYAEVKLVNALELVKPKDDPYKYPHIMKRNARYRGHRESEKVLSSNQEQIYDIRQNYVDIQSLTDLQESWITSWFQGENEAPSENLTFTTTKTFTANTDQSMYPLIPGAPAGAFSSVVVELNGKTLSSPTDYVITDGWVNIKSSALQSGTLNVTYTATIRVMQQRMFGIYEIMQRMQRMDERIGELERRYGRYEDAYQ
jgi:hypothetical protein